ncbi:DUF1641 domain-containing protein [Halobellus rarus]|uniref:DUF1641 domain-containing protein n=1 Tax=Halobellus rarus TaxID=1126237 RepID=A0ABD6CK96_9EURY|nr:DUF1641 domain-containing protein [Halobellus rarus]
MSEEEHADESPAGDETGHDRSDGADDGDPPADGGDAPVDGGDGPTELAGDDLEAAIAENPEAVASFVRRLDAVNELLDVLALGESALDDEMVRSLAGTGSTLVESADGLATEETVELAAAVGDNGEELQGALESLLVLQRTGTLKELVEVADVLSLLTSALDDEMVRSLAGTGSALGEVAQTAGDDDVRDGLETLLSGVGEAANEEPERVGAVGLLKRSRDPDVQYGLGFLLALAGAIGQSSADDRS